MSTSHWWCGAHNLTPKTYFFVHTPHFLKHLLRLELLLTCAVLPAQPAVALFHSFCPQNHNSSLCFKMPFRMSVNPTSLLGSLRASLQSSQRLYFSKEHFLLAYQIVQHVEIKMSELKSYYYYYYYYNCSLCCIHCVLPLKFSIYKKRPYPIS